MRLRPKALSSTYWGVNQNPSDGECPLGHKPKYSDQWPLQMHSRLNSLGAGGINCN